jgi:hypothetical protein
LHFFCQNKANYWSYVHILKGLFDWIVHGQMTKTRLTPFETFSVMNSAFHYGTETKPVDIPICHVNLNSGFSIPIINDWSNNTTVLTSAYDIGDEIQTGLNPTKFIFVCSKEKNEEPQLLIFGVVVTSKKNGELVFNQCCVYGHMETCQVFTPDRKHWFLEN